MKSTPTHPDQQDYKLGSTFNCSLPEINGSWYEGLFDKVKHGSTIIGADNLFIVKGYLGNDRVVMSYIDCNGTELMLDFFISCIKKHFTSTNDDKRYMLTLETYRKYIDKACYKWQQIIDEKVGPQLLRKGEVYLSQDFIKKLYQHSNSEQKEILKTIFKIGLKKLKPGEFIHIDSEECVVLEDTKKCVRLIDGKILNVTTIDFEEN